MIWHLGIAESISELTEQAWLQVPEDDPVRAGHYEPGPIRCAATSLLRLLEVQPSFDFQRRSRSRPAVHTLSDVEASTITRTSGALEIESTISRNSVHILSSQLLLLSTQQGNILIVKCIDWWPAISRQTRHSGYMRIANRLNSSNSTPGAASDTL